MEEELINRIKEYPQIYDPSSALYYNRNIKENCWEKAVLGLNITVSEAIEKRKYLRDRYVRAKKKEKEMQRSGAGNSSTKRTDSNLFSDNNSSLNDTSTSTNASSCYTADEDGIIYVNVDEALRGSSSGTSTANETPKESVSKLACRRRKKNQHSSGDEFEKKIRELISDDEDKMFLLSLLLAMKKLAAEKSSEVKMAMLQVLHTAQFDD